MDLVLFRLILFVAFSFLAAKNMRVGRDHEHTFLKQNWISDCKIHILLIYTIIFANQNDVLFKENCVHGHHLPSVL